MHARIRLSAQGVGMVAAIMVGVAACGHSTAPTQPGGTTTPISSHPATSLPATVPGSVPATTPPTPSAADQLAAFAAAAGQADAHLHHAAALVNGDIGTTSIHFTPTTIAAVRALGNTPVAHAIPAGLPPELLRAVLTTYGDLESRTGALSGILLYDYSAPEMPIGGQDAKGVLRCLHNGAPAAARFDADLAAVLALAHQAPPLTVAPADSRAAAELALRIYSIDKHNTCSYACGDYAPTQLEPVIWHPRDDQHSGHFEGTISGAAFEASYHAGSGWEIDINAC